MAAAMEALEMEKAAKKAAKAKAKAKEVEEEEEEGIGGNLGSGGTHKLAVCTGVLASRKDSRDVKITSFSISLFGTLLFEDQTIELTYGHRYGLIAQVAHFSHMSHPTFPTSHLLICFCEFRPPHPFLPYVAAHFSHISPLNLFFEFRPPRPFLPYVAPHFSHISPLNRIS